MKERRTLNMLLIHPLGTYTPTGIKGTFFRMATVCVSIDEANEKYIF